MSILNLPFLPFYSMLPFVAMNHKTKDLSNPFDSLSDYRLSHLSQIIGIFVAFFLHMFFLLAINSSKPVEKMTLPTPITVNWIANTVQQKTQEPMGTTPISIPTPAKPVIEKQRTIEKSKPVIEKIKPLSHLQNTSHLKPLIASTATLSDIKVDNATKTATSEDVSQKSNEKTIATTSEINNSSSQNTANPQPIEQPLILPHLNASYLNNPPPIYPQISRQLSEEGKVLVRVLVNEKGDVDQAVIKKSSHYERLDNAALDAIKQWRFVPAKRGETIVSAWVVVPISFNLEN
jgi:protein TonB